VGNRLVRAREARGLSAVTLAELVRVSPQSISHYEQDKHSPSPEVMDAIASALKVPRSFFLRPSLPPRTAPIFWRSNLGALKSARRRAEARLIWLEEMVAYLTQFFDFPALRLPAPAEVDHRLLSSGDIEALAAECRKLWGIDHGPVHNVCSSLEANGIVIGRMRVDAYGLDAFSHWPSHAANPYILLGTDKSNPARSRFDGSHELAHLVLHRNVDEKRLNSPAEFKLLEAQAHRFASAFLMPAESFTKELWSVSLDSMLNIKERWGCSIASMISRCQNLGMLNEDQAKRLWINYARRGWRTNEPMDDRVQAETPTLLRRSFEMLVSEGGQPRRQILLQLHLDADDVEEIASLPNGFFSDRADAARFGPQFRHAEGVSQNRGGAQVIDFTQARRA